MTQTLTLKPRGSRKLTALVLVSALALTACTNPDRFGSSTNANGALGANGGMIAGSANDPSSVAYFNQAIGDRVLFLVDQSTLTDESRGLLAQQAGWLMANPAYTAIIEGHADEQGTRDYNLALGSRRAAAVQDYLISQGVNPARLKPITYGKERPIEVCSSEVCYAKNRRAVTVLAAGAGIS
ncbi:peptidoglycan-associated lipoprotein Pal [Pacificibacter marinus]|uniref:Peptidoglycan-associated protein n=1 Tax=Pacificibacter marinus TaxID=658057 RepID=A0A1Y5RKX7_9RHOB|nr:peptidoglycan-associated lipoprotein Pal [Pacificibacter marinus]SEK19730.1 peptidoglycan-associated lipoprotein [Pacificibacter marinus]SLN17004.1 Outer membrane lipoprotein Omp16 precursor [Pacificibacter marinus]